MAHIISPSNLLVSQNNCRVCDNSDHAYIFGAMKVRVSELLIIKEFNLYTNLGKQRLINIYPLFSSLSLVKVVRSFFFFFFFFFFFSPAIPNLP